jgi:RHS repeat-associated protein
MRDAQIPSAIADASVSDQPSPAQQHGSDGPIVVAPPTGGSRDARPKNPKAKHPPKLPDIGLVNLRAKYHRVDVHGVPVPDKSPTGEGEVDRLANLAHIDMYSLAPTFSVTDIAVAMEGGELALELRRTLGIRSRGISRFPQARPIPWATKTILGLGWDTNLSCRAIVSWEYGDPATVEIIDEIGNVYQYTCPSGTFLPNVRHSFASDAVAVEVTAPSTNLLQARLQYGTTITFEKVRDKTNQNGAHHETYYRPIRIVDRNGNTINYEYDDTKQQRDQDLLVRAIWEDAHPERRITFQYADYGEDLGVSDLGSRLSSATDPLGRTYSYAYASTGGDSSAGRFQLQSVTQPQVPDPTTSPLVQVSPVVSFSYHIVTLPTDDPAVDNAYASPASITDPRGHATRFTYVVEPFPILAQPNGTAVQFQQTPRVATVTTVDGTAELATLRRTPRQVLTTTTDTRGVTVRYDFRLVLVDAFNSWGSAFCVVSLDRSTISPSGPLTARFEWSATFNSNLLRVLDISGNEILYDYRSNDVTDPYDRTRDPLQPRDDQNNPSLYQVFDQPARRIVDPKGLRLITDYRYEPKFNKLLSTTDPQGQTVHYVFDGRGNRTATIEPLGKISQYAYAGDGFTEQETDPIGRLTRYARQFNAADLTHHYTTTRTVLSSPLVGGSFDIVTSVTTDVLGNRRVIVDGEGGATLQTFDNLNRLTTVENPAVENPTDPAGPPVMSSIQRMLDLNGNVVAAVDENGNVVTTQFDSMNRPILVRQRMSDPTSDDDVQDLIWRTAYDPVGLVKETTDPNGNVTASEYDVLLRLVRKRLPRVALPNGSMTQYEELWSYGENCGAGAFTYWTGWQPTRVLNRRGFATDFVYDKAYRLLRTVRRHDDGSTIAPTDPPRPGEPTSARTVNRVSQIVTLATANESSAGTDESRATYTYYDALHRPTVAVVDIDGSGPPLALDTVIDDPNVLVADPGALVSRTYYDLAGQIFASSDPAGNVTNLYYDMAGRLVQRVGPETTVFDPSRYNPSGQMQMKESVTYDRNGNAVLREDQNHVRTQFVYDARNRLVRTSLDLNGDGTFSSTFGGPDLVSERHYDLKGRLIRTKDSRGAETVFSFDRADRKILKQLPQVPDARNGGRLIAPETRYDYDKNSNVLSVTDSLGTEARNAYDALNRVVSATSAEGSAAELKVVNGYDANGNLIRLTVVNSSGDQVTEYAFDAYDRRIRENLPDIGDGIARTTVTVYDRLGSVIGVTDPAGQLTERTYDRAGRLVASIHRRADGSIEEVRSFQYDKLGSPLLVSDLNGTSFYDYDPYRRILRERREGAGMLRYDVLSSYDANGNRTRCVLPDTNRTLEYSYDRANRLVAVNDGGRQTRFGFDSNGNQTSLVLPNAVQIATTFDALNRVSTITASHGGTNIYSVAYGHDRVGNRVSASERRGTHVRDLSYGYDEQYRLTEARSPGHAYVYAYDAVGNRLEMSDTAGAAPIRDTYVYDKLNRLVRMQHGSAQIDLVYDANGNLVKRESGSRPATVYRWDASNRLIAAETSGTVDFRAQYDYRFRRLKVDDGPDAKDYRYDGGTSAQELETGTVSREMVRVTGLGGGIASILYSDELGSSPQEETFVYDALGNTIALTGQRGTVTAAYEYDPFGLVTVASGGSSNTRFANTKELDRATGLYNHGLRYYDPVIGRYISRDPSGYASGPNVYVYVHNNPVNRIDPLGLWDWGDFLDTLAVGLVTVAVVAVVVVAAPVVAAAAVGAAAELAGGVALAAGASAATAGAIAGEVAVAGTAVAAEAGLIGTAALEAAGIVGTADMMARSMTGQMTLEEATANAVTMGVGGALAERIGGMQDQAPRVAQDGANESSIGAEGQNTQLDPQRIAEEAGRMKGGNVTIEDQGAGPTLVDPNDPNYRAILDGDSPRPGTGYEWHADHMPAKGAANELPPESWPEGKPFVRVDWQRAKKNMSMGGGTDKATKNAIKGMKQAGRDRSEMEKALLDNLDEHMTALQEGQAP